MAALGVDVEFGGDFGVLELLVVDEGVFYVDGVVFSLDDEGGRGVGGGVNFRVVDKARNLRTDREGEVAGVDDYGEVGAAT